MADDGFEDVPFDEQEWEERLEERYQRDLAQRQASLREADLWDLTIRTMVTQYGWNEAKAKKFMELWPRKARELRDRCGGL